MRRRQSARSPGCPVPETPAPPDPKERLAHWREIASTWLETMCKSYRYRIHSRPAAEIVEMVARVNFNAEQTLHEVKVEMKAVEAGSEKVSEQLDKAERLRAHAASLSRQVQAQLDNLKDYNDRCDRYRARGYWRRLVDAAVGRSLA